MKSYFLDLLAAKQRTEDRRISFRTVAKETGLSEYTVRGFANNTLREYPADALAALCAYFRCDVGDLLHVEELPQSK